MRNLNGMVAWVTGAGTGIGAGAAIALAREGVHVILKRTILPSGYGS